MRFALEALTSADKYITANIINDVKEYIEDTNKPYGHRNLKFHLKTA